MESGQLVVNVEKRFESTESRKQKKTSVSYAIPCDVSRLQDGRVRVEGGINRRFWVL
jgi:hypothetical protein